MLTRVSQVQVISGKARPLRLESLNGICPSSPLPRCSAGNSSWTSRRGFQTLHRLNQPPSSSSSRPARADPLLSVSQCTWSQLPLRSWFSSWPLPETLFSPCGFCPPQPGS